MSQFIYNHFYAIFFLCNESGRLRREPAGSRKVKLSRQLKQGDQRNADDPGRYIGILALSNPIVSQPCEPNHLAAIYFIFYPHVRLEHLDSGQVRRSEIEIVAFT